MLSTLSMDSIKSIYASGFPTPITQHGVDNFTDLATELAASGVEVDVRRSMGADVGDQVLAVAADVAADLIVIGLRRRSPVGKLLMGSVAQRILLGAECAVLAVKPGA